jgi:hypothetical protein
MRTSSRWHLVVLAVGLAMPTAAFTLEAGTREVPAKEIAVPTADVSPQEQALIGAPLPPIWNDHPNDAAAWKALIKTRADQIVKTLPDMREKFGVKSEQVTIAGVNCYILTPDNIPEQNGPECARGSWHRICNLRHMPLYYFKLVDSRIVSDYGVHQLADEDAARKAAIELAQSIREARPDFVGQGCSVSVTDEDGTGICVVPVDVS